MGGAPKRRGRGGRGGEEKKKNKGGHATLLEYR